MKPCPFCGDVDVRHHSTPIGRRVKCMTCHAEGPPADPRVKGTTREETYHLRVNHAEVLWDKRAPIEDDNDNRT